MDRDDLLSGTDDSAKPETPTADTKNSNDSPTNPTEPPNYATQDQFNQLTQYVAQLAQGIQSFAQNRNSEPATPEPPKPSTLDDVIDNPDDWVRSKIDERISARIGPVEAQRAEESYQQNLEAERSTFDAKYGEGAFDELILPDIESTLANMSDPSPIKAFRTQFSQLVNWIRGGKDDALYERRLKAETDRKKAEETRMNPPDLPNGGHYPAPKPRQLSAYERELVNKANYAHGANWSGSALDESVDLRDALSGGLGQDGNGGIKIADIQKWAKAHGGKK